MTDRALGFVSGEAALRSRFGYRLTPAFRRASDTATLDAIRKQSVIPEAVDASSFLLVRAVISTGEPDAYKTVMDVSTLTNYAADAAAGVSVLYGHDRRAIVGRSFSGRYAARPAPGRCESECFIPEGVELGDQRTDDVIHAVSVGMLRDVSVGFTGGELRCSICERSIWDHACPHVPGVLYTVDGTRNPVEALAIVSGAHLAEYSLVYAGATPSASVLEAKALREVDAGRLAPETARALEVAHRGLDLHASHRAWAGFKRGAGTAERRASSGSLASADDAEDDGADAPVAATESGTGRPGPVAAHEAARTESDEEEQVPTPTTPSLEERIATLLSTVVEGEVSDVASALAAVTTELRAARPAVAELETVRAQVAAEAPLVAYGRAWLEREVAHALAEGQRALGEKFVRATWEPVLRAMEPEAVRLMADGWTQQGDLLFRPGRQTTDAAPLRSGGAAPPGPGGAGAPISPAFAAGFRA